MAITPKWTLVSEGCWRDESSANPVYLIVNTAAPDGAADPQASATKGSLYFRPGTTDDYSQVYMKVADNDADADWQKILVNNNEEAVSMEGDWTWDTSSRINFRDTTLYIYSPAASTAAIALGASGDVWQIGDQASSNYIQIDFTGEVTLVGTARFNPRAAFEIFDDFIQQTLVETDTPWILNKGTDGSAVDPAINAQEVGVVRLTTGAGDGSTAEDASQLVGHIPVQADSGGLVFEARLHLNTGIVNVAVNVGLTDSTAREEPFSIGGGDAVTANATDATCFVFDTDADTDEWWMMAVDSGAEDTGNAATGTAPTADTYQKFRIEIAADGNTVKYYIDDTLEGTLTNAGVTANVNLYPTVIAVGDGTASKTIDVDYVYVGHTR